MIDEVNIIKIIFGVLAVFVVFFVISLIELQTQVGRYQAYWDNQNSRATQPNEILYVALGDSTAQGIGASSPQKGYVGLIAKELEQKKGDPVHTVNFSKTGAKIDDVLNRQLPLLEKLQISDKTVITIEIGANNIGSFSAAEFEQQMDELMGKLPKQTIISDIPYFGGGLRSRLEPKVLQANEIMFRLAAKHNFKLVPLHAKIMENHNSLKDYAADRFHPSNHNYKTSWAPAFFEGIN